MHSTFKIKHCLTKRPLGTSLIWWFAFYLLEKDIFKLKKKIGEVLNAM